MKTKTASTVVVPMKDKATGEAVLVFPLATVSSLQPGDCVVMRGKYKRGCVVIEKEAVDRNELKKKFEPVKAGKVGKTCATMLKVVGKEMRLDIKKSLQGVRYKKYAVAVAVAEEV